MWGNRKTADNVKDSSRTIRRTILNQFEKDTAIVKRYVNDN